MSHLVMEWIHAGSTKELHEHLDILGNISETVYKVQNFMVSAWTFQCCDGATVDILLQPGRVVTLIQTKEVSLIRCLLTFARSR